MSSAPAGGAAATTSSSSSPSEVLECAVCLQPCVHPAQLDCDHIFCFLCIKGVATQNRRCPMCRRDIAPTFLENPKLVRPIVSPEPAAPKPSEGSKAEEGDQDADADEREHDWFYEGHNGWWQYDERASAELEKQRRAGAKHCELLIAGYVYVIDLEAMMQFRRNDPSRRRRVKRDRDTAPKKGIAGLRLGNRQQQHQDPPVVGVVAQPLQAQPRVPPVPPPRAAPPLRDHGDALRQLQEQMALNLIVGDQEEQEDEDEGGAPAEDDRQPPRPPPRAQLGRQEEEEQQQQQHQLRQRRRHQRQHNQHHDQDPHTD